MKQGNAASRLGDWPATDTVANDSSVGAGADVVMHYNHRNNPHQRALATVSEQGELARASTLLFSM